MIENCKNKLIIKTNDNKKAKKLIEKEYDITDIDDEDDTIVLYSNLDDSADINKFLIDKGIKVSEIYTKVDSLEDYFIRRIGE